MGPQRTGGMRNENNVELKWLFVVIWRWAWLIVGCAFLAGILAYLLSSRMPPTYAASLTLLVDPAEQAAASVYNDLMAGERLALTYSQMLRGQRVLEAASAQLGLDIAPSELAKKIVVEPVNGTQLIRLTVTDSSAEQAAQLANTIADVFADQVNELQSERYKTSLASMQAKMNGLQQEVETTQAKIDALNAEKIADQQVLTRLQNQLAEMHASYAELQATEQDLSRTLVDLRDSVRIAQAAERPGATAAHTQTQTATVTLLVDLVASGGQGDYSAVLANERLAETYAQLLSARPPLPSALGQIAVQEWPDDWAQKIRVRSVPGTQLIQLRVEDADPARAVDLANTAAEMLLQQLLMLLQQPYRDRISSATTELAALTQTIDDVQAQVEALTAAQVQRAADLAQFTNLLAEYRSDYRSAERDYEQLRVSAQESADTLTVTESADIPRNPSQSTLLYMTLAITIGVLSAAALACLLEYLDEGIRSPADVKQALSLSTLAVIGRIPSKRGSMVVGQEASAVVAEEFLTLAANIRRVVTEQGLRTWLVTSATPAEGKSIVAANLAAALASTGLRVIVVDANLRRPTVHRLLGVDGSRGLTDALRLGNTHQFLQSSAKYGLRVLPAGTLPVSPAAVLGSLDLPKLLDELAQEADLLLIDSPAVLGLADTRMLASTVDGVLLAVRAAHTRAHDALSAIDILLQTGAQWIGVVLNAAPARSSSHARYYHRSASPARTRPSPVEPQHLGGEGQSVSALSTVGGSTRSAQPFVEDRLYFKEF